MDQFGSVNNKILTWGQHLFCKKSVW